MKPRKRTPRKKEELPETDESTPTTTTTTVTVVPPQEPTWQELVTQLPEPKSVPTQRWYGETFYPQYKKVYRKLKALIE